MNSLTIIVRGFFFVRTFASRSILTETLKHFSIMTIKTEDGMCNVTGSGQGIYNTVGASAGIASLLGVRLGNLFCGMECPVGRDGSHYVTKDELNYVQTIAAKDSEIALLKSEQNTEIKIADVYERLITRINADKAEQNAINSQQMVYNATANSAIAVMQNQIASLQSLTKVIVPADNVCPKPMPQYNSWTAPTA